jgi:uncharacterized protein DUF1573
VKGRIASAGLALALSFLPARPGITAPDAPASPPAAARIVIEPDTFDFGTVRAGRVVEKEFLVRNHGGADLVISSLVSSCGCTGALTDTSTIKPGGSTALRVRFTAPDTAGRLEKSVLVKSNDPAHPTFEVKIEAVVAAGKASRHR